MTTALQSAAEDPAQAHTMLPADISCLQKGRVTYQHAIAHLQLCWIRELLQQLVALLMAAMSTVVPSIRRCLLLSMHLYCRLEYDTGCNRVAEFGLQILAKACGICWGSKYAAYQCDVTKYPVCGINGHQVFWIAAADAITAAWEDMGTDTPRVCQCRRCLS